MVAITFGQDTVAVTFPLVPLSFVDVLIRVDHAALTLWEAIDPVAVVPVAVFIEEGASTVHLVLEPVARVLTTKLAAFIAPVCPLSVSFVNRPHAFVLITLLVVLDAEPFLAVVLPVPDVA